MRNQRGITLVTLVTTIVLLSIITGTVSISFISSLEIKRYNELKEDINLLEEKTALYYLENGELPIDAETVNICDIIENYDDKNINYNQRNSEVLHKINLEKLNIGKLNFKNYYVDEKSHTIYLEKPIKFNENFYYTVK